MAKDVVGARGAGGVMGAIRAMKVMGLWLRRGLMVWGLMFSFMGGCWALPTLAQVQESVRAGDFDRAQTMLEEVVRAQPQSPGAHYLLAQVLIAKGQYAPARAAMLRAQEIDPQLRFAPDPQRFRGILQGLDEAIAKTTPAQPSAPAPAPASASTQPESTANPVAPSTTTAAPAPGTSSTAARTGSSGGNFPWFIVILGAVALVAWWFTRSKRGGEGHDGR